ncbi:hypothetical protein ACFRI7_32130 [Streptomyces sp. NPDC056716]|uniref:hypothetical protein n=1 Tax=unclassified Streptomyces TaxID=2593676 RepID=UPI003689CE7F
MTRQTVTEMPMKAIGPTLGTGGLWSPPAPVAAVLLGMWLRHRRLGAGLSTGAVADVLDRTTGEVHLLESGLAAPTVPQALAAGAAVGIDSEAEREAVTQLTVNRDPVFRDLFPGAAERLTAAEQAAGQMTAVALGPLWPAQWDWDPPVPVPSRAGPRPWPRALTTLVLQDQLLYRRSGCPQHTARRLTALAHRTETGLDLRIVSFRSPQLTALANLLGALCSRFNLPSGRTLCVSEGYEPSYRADPAAEAAIDTLLAAAVSGPDAAAALRTAAQQHAADRCETAHNTRSEADCGCPASPAARQAPGREAVVAVVRHGHDILLVPDPSGELRPPSTVTRLLESPSTAALRAVWDQVPCAPVVTAHLSSPAPGGARYVLCALPGPRPEPQPPTRWAPADSVPRLPPLPASATADDADRAPRQGRPTQPKPEPRTPQEQIAQDTTRPS